LPARAVGRAIAKYSMVASDATIMELAEVLARGKFDSYVTIEERKQFLRLFGRIVEIVPVLELAVNAAADDGRRSSARPGRISRHSDHDPNCVPRGR
jgi:hypothetical protein